MKAPRRHPRQRWPGSVSCRAKATTSSAMIPRSGAAKFPRTRKIEYRDDYPGVNLVYYGNQRQLDTNFVVSPAPIPKAITLAFEAWTAWPIDALGDSVLRADGASPPAAKPVVYQEQNGPASGDPTRYVLKAGAKWLEVAAYDGHEPLIIDPVLAYSTYLGGRASASAGTPMMRASASP